VNNLYSVLDNAATHYAENVAITFGDHKITYKAMKEACDRLAMGFKSMGLKRGDRIALMLPNVPHFAMSYFALLKTGIAIVPISILYKAEEIHHQLEDSEVKGIIYWQGVREQVMEAVQGLGRCDKMMVLGEKSVPEEIRLTFLIESKDATEDIADVGSDDTALISYAAGITGRPRGAELTHGNLMSNIRACSDFLKLSANDSVVGVLCLHHPMALTLVMGSFFSVGGRILLLPKFDAQEVLKAVETEKPTYLVGVPSMYRKFLNTGDVDNIDISSLRYCLSSGYALKEETLEAFESKFKVPILEGYGLTEASPMISFNSPMRERKAGSIGLPLPGVEMKIIDESGSEVRAGQVGEIIVQGSNVMKGYLNRPEATKEVLIDGWLHTGDLALLHENGYGYIVERKKEVIVKSGFNVYPREVEKFLVGHPKIKEAAVVGVPDAAYGEEIHAFLVLKEGEEADQDEILNYIKERIATYKCPKIVHFIPELPKGPTGRVMRDNVKQTLLKNTNESDTKEVSKGGIL